MEQVTFIAQFGNQLKKVTLSRPFGSGSGLYQVLIDNFYKGRIHKKDGVWISLDLDESFTMDDIGAMGEHIDAAE